MNRIMNLIEERGGSLSRWSKRGERRKRCDNQRTGFAWDTSGLLFSFSP